MELSEALAAVRSLITSPDLVRAVAAGRQRGRSPSVLRATLRPVRLKAGLRLQLVTEDGMRPTTRNLAPGAPELDQLLAEPFGNWHVATTGETLQLRVTKKGGALVHRAPVRQQRDTPATTHDREKEHLLDPGDPLYDVIGGNAAKRRQVDAFLRQLDAVLAGGPGPRIAQPAGQVSAQLPLHIADLGCGNAYLTFAAYRFLTQRGVPVRITGVDVRADQRERNTALAGTLGWSGAVRFQAASIADAELGVVDGKVDMVLALHACDTATDEALARAVAWRAQWILAAPCCHQDVSRQLRDSPQTSPLIEHAILRERFADVLTDAARAGLLREHGYQVEVVEFIDSAHTPRNVLLRCTYTGANRRDPQLAALLAQWEVMPALATLLPASH